MLTVYELHREQVCELHKKFYIRMVPYIFKFKVLLKRQLKNRLIQDIFKKRLVLMFYIISIFLIKLLEIVSNCIPK